MTTMDFLEALKWRYATKKFDAQKSIPQDQLDQIIEATQLSPSSVNLQPYKLILISDRKSLEQLTPATWLPNHAKLENCSALAIITVPTKIDEENVDAFLDQIASDKGIPRDSLAEVEAKMKGFIMGMTPEARIEWARRQAYLALGTMLSACAMARIDSCPMEGFVAADLDRLLDLPDKQLTATVLVALGYRASDDPAMNIPKYRRGITTTAHVD